MALPLGAARISRCAALFAALFVCLIAAGCGTEGKLSTSEADRALNALDSAEQYFNEGKCTRAKLAARRLSSIALNATSSGGFREDFRQSADRLEELIVLRCQEAKEEPTGPTGATEPTGATGATDGEGPPPDDGGATPTPPDDGGVPPTPPDDGGDDGGNPGSGGVRPE